MLLLPIGFMAPAAVTAALLLDGISATVKGAYGMRKLRTGYAGPALRVRRSLDNAEQDIGFTVSGDPRGSAAGGLDTAALLAFCGASDGFVSKWYDQSGLGQDVAQVVAGQQPQVVAQGVVATLTNAAGPANSSGIARDGRSAPGRPCLRFSNQNTMLTHPGFALGVPAFGSASVAVASAQNGGSARLLTFQSQGSAVDYQDAGSAIFGYGGSSLTAWQNGGKASVAISAASPFQYATVWSAARVAVAADGAGSSGSGCQPAAATGTLAIGARPDGNGNGTEGWDGGHSEHIVFASDVSAADQAAVRASQQAYYGTP